MSKRARGKASARKVGGAKNKAPATCQKTIYSCIFRVRQRTLKADWLISHQVFPLCYTHVDIDSNVKMAVLTEKIDKVISQVISDIQLVINRFIQLKEEQAKAVLFSFRREGCCCHITDGYGKSLIYQVFVRARDYQRQGNAAILVISPLNSIIN